MLLVVIAIVLAVEMKGLLIGESASAADVERIRAAVDGGASVTRTIHMRTQHLGPEEVLVAAKVEYDHGLTVEQLADAIDDTERAIRQAVPVARLIYIEPDILRRDPEHP